MTKMTSSNGGAPAVLRVADTTFTDTSARKTGPATAAAKGTRHDSLALRSPKNDSLSKSTDAYERIRAFSSKSGQIFTPKDLKRDSVQAKKDSSKSPR